MVKHIFYRSKKICTWISAIVCVVSIFSITIDGQADTIRGSSSIFHINFGLTEALMPGTLRFGRNNFELGIYPGFLFGGGGIINVPNSNIYATIAVGIINDDLGFYGGLGFEFYKVSPYFNWRVELGGTGSFVYNYTSGHAIVGANVGF